ncbi:ComF family protein [Sphingomonas sp. SFZ2018-12]|uniref:ComF family protein n=1 Tax=Sphingomonas sp. SFZ2018-12 TaxID=2683197 RepID=UPI001F109F0B|nr:ComF family protein [Sphingomonas sp. SFZ2018-12]MCH4892716.1 ComF family protein [Sphingomonas sp. SFZ2018-12]
MLVRARILARPLHRLVNLALPPRCPGCGEVVEADHRLCAACWRDLAFPGAPACAGCGTPFAFDRGDAARCAACLSHPPAHDGVTAAVAYGRVASILALKLKYGRRLGVAVTMARLMARHLDRSTEHGPLLVPVPLHRWRLWSRGFNQSLLIARALAQSTGLSVAPAALVRTRSTRALRGMGPGQRARTLAGAFAVPAAARATVRGRDIVLIDDVYTTGATADGCVHALKRAGAARVQVLCWARVLRDAEVGD